MQKEEIIALWNRYRDGEATNEDVALLESWYLEYEELNRVELGDEEISTRINAVANQLPLNLNRKTIKLWPRLVAAASIALAIGISIWFFSIRNQELLGNVQVVNLKDVAPGKNTATLTLANGDVIALSDMKTGVVINGGTLAYNDQTVIGSAGSDKAGEALTASTPRGGQYQIILADGTKVWLNASTSLKFPQSFKGALNRIVELTGEAYFEVAKDQKHPFFVKTDKQNIRVLGTHFNVNNYSDEPSIKTTLLEGSIEISSNSVSKILIPGEQAILTNNNNLKIANADLDQAVAWKNGVFQFYRADVKTVMRTLSRWYNVEVEYQGDIPEHEFTGKIFKRVSASAALNILSELGVKFKIDGQKIIVIPL